MYRYYTAYLLSYVECLSQVVDLNYFPVTPTMMDMSICSEYSVFDKLYAIEVELESTDNDTAANTESQNGSESSTFSAHQSDTSEGTDCYIMSVHSEPRVDFTDLHMQTDKCHVPSDEVNGSANIHASFEEQRNMQTSTTTQQETVDEPPNIEDSVSPVRAGYITY